MRVNNEKSKLKKKNFNTLKAILKNQIKIKN